MPTVQYTLPRTGRAAFAYFQSKTRHKHYMSEHSIENTGHQWAIGDALEHEAPTGETSAHNDSFVKIKETIRQLGRQGAKFSFNSMLEFRRMAKLYPPNARALGVSFTIHKVIGNPELLEQAYDRYGTGLTYGKAKEIRDSHDRLLAARAQEEQPPEQTPDQERAAYARERQSEEAESGRSIQFDLDSQELEVNLERLIEMIEGQPELSSGVFIERFLSISQRASFAANLLRNRQPTTTTAQRSQHLSIV